MKKRTTKHRLLLPAGATTTITEPLPGDMVQLRCPDTKELLDKQMILGFAHTPDGLTFYVTGPVSSALRTSMEFGPRFVQEQWFGLMPDTIAELMTEDYARGHLLLYRATDQEELPLLQAA